MTAIRHFYTCAALQLRRAARLMPTLLAMALAAVLLAAGAAAAGGALLAGRGFAGLRLAVAAEDGDERITTLAESLAGMGDVTDGLAELRVTSPDEAEALVRRGAVNAAILLPPGFWDSLMSGENLSPRLIVDSARPLETLLVTRLASSAASMLTRAQQGIAFTLELFDAHRPEQLARRQVMLGANLAYGAFVLDHGTMISTVSVSPTGALSVGQHYLLAALLVFSALCLPVLYRVLAMNAQRGWLDRLRGAGCPVWAYALGQVVAGALAMLAVLLVLAAGVWLLDGHTAAPGLAVLPGLLLCALALGCFGFLCCNAGGVLAAAGLSFLITLAGLVTFGGLVPLVLLPAPVAALAPFSPMGWMHRVLAPLFGTRADLAALGLTALLCAGLLGLCLLTARRRERRAAL